MKVGFDLGGPSEARCHSRSIEVVLGLHNVHDFLERLLLDNVQLLQQEARGIPLFRVGNVAMCRRFGISSCSICVLTREDGVDRVHCQRGSTNKAKCRADIGDLPQKRCKLE